MTHPQVLANQMVVTAQDAEGETQQLVGTPFKLADGGGIAAMAPPNLGADTDALLAELGLSTTEIQALR